MSVTKIVTGPQSYPVTIDEAKLHGRITNDAEDSLVSTLISAATNRVEKITGRVLISQTWREYFDSFPPVILLRKGDVQSVTSVNYTDTADVDQVIDAADYDADVISNPARIIPTFGKSWPSNVKNKLNPIYVEYLAGFGEDSSNVPDDIRWALFMLIAHFYENREASTDLKLIETPMGVDSLLAAYKIWWMR